MLLRRSNSAVREEEYRRPTGSILFILNLRNKKNNGKLSFYLVRTGNFFLELTRVEPVVTKQCPDIPLGDVLNDHLTTFSHYNLMSER